MAYEVVKEEGTTGNEGCKAVKEVSEVGHTQSKSVSDAALTASVPSGKSDLDPK